MSNYVKRKIYSKHRKIFPTYLQWTITIHSVSFGEVSSVALLRLHGGWIQFSTVSPNSLPLRSVVCIRFLCHCLWKELLLLIFFFFPHFHFWRCELDKWIPIQPYCTGWMDCIGIRGKISCFVFWVSYFRWTGRLAQDPWARKINKLRSPISKSV